MPTFETVVKSQGIVAFAKAVVDCGRCDSRHRARIHQGGRRLRRRAIACPASRSAKAFARVFTADDETGLTLRKAHQIVKNGPTMTLTPDLCRRHRGNRCQRSGRRAGTAPGAGRAAARQHAGAVEGASFQQDLLRPEQCRPGRCRAPAEPAGRLIEFRRCPWRITGPCLLTFQGSGRRGSRFPLGRGPRRLDCWWWMRLGRPGCRGLDGECHDGQKPRHAGGAGHSCPLATGNFLLGVNDEPIKQTTTARSSSTAAAPSPATQTSRRSAASTRRSSPFLHAASGDGKSAATLVSAWRVARNCVGSSGFGLGFWPITIDPFMAPL